jgi:hypothetical protein
MRATTPINIEVIEHELHDHPDQKFVSTLVSGLKEGFHTGIHPLPTISYICKNLQSALRNPETVTKLLQDEIDKGFVIGPFKEPPFEIYRINPIGIAEHKYSHKQRLILDLSAPHNGVDHTSLNELVDKAAFSVSYVKIDDAIRIIKTLGQGAVLTKTDIVDAFKLLPIRPDLWRFHGLQWNGKFYFFVRLCFGSRSSPKIFTMLSEAIHYIASHNYGMKHLLYLLDDFLSIDPPEGHTPHASPENPQRSLSLFHHVFGRLNVPLHPTKTVGPVTTLMFLGITLDTVKMFASLPQDKVDRIVQILCSFEERNNITKRELLSLLGHLNFASRVIVPGRSFVSYLLSLASSVKELHHHVRLSKECLSDIHMWRVFLTNWNGISFFYDDNITDSADYELFTDASGSKGYGAYFQGKWFSQPWTARCPQLGDDDMSIAFMELVPIVTCAVRWGSCWTCKRILFHCDNLATVCIISKGRSKSPLIMQLLRRLTLSAATNNYIVHAKHIPGKFNIFSDCLSRLQITKFRQLAPRADPLPTQVPSLEELYLT